MSDTTIAEQLADLSPAILTIYTQLVTFTEPATVDDIAQAAKTARSSTFKALVTLEKRGLAHRDRGIQNGPNRCPDLWRANHTKAAPTPNWAPAQEEPTAPAPTSQPVADTTKPATEPDQPTANAPEEKSDTTVPAQAVPAATLPAQRTEPSQPSHRAPTTALTGGTKRLAPGGLRQLVIDHLNAHPGEAFTTTRISRTIDRSSGAINNALEKLVRQDIAEQVSERPRTYRLATPEHNG
ncbi:putative transcriptional regulator [Streptomyces umbrinus]|uniref:Transcriptional regulator n=1 Tax=Streptomyces umbrinus TaxID=67370 RepID=A0ABU0SM50_9ACTN|nr:helix-turn-helix domain-containing protein [Streptomyces umbrinus]MDQ1024630.1 putative transcriptional regulator [Streptomyces umbrinus]